MPEELEDLREMQGEAEPLVLPIGGRRYAVKPCSADVWLRLQVAMEKVNGRAVSDDDDTLFDTDLYRLALGETFDELLPNVTGAELAKCGMTAWYWQTGHRIAAIAYWRSGGKARASTTTSTSTDEASTSPTPASGSGTTSRPKSSAGARPRKARSGARSSATGH